MKFETRRPSFQLSNLSTFVLLFLLSSFATSCFENPLGELTAPIDELPGFRPTFTGVSPAAIANDNNPAFSGNSLADVSITVFSDSTCQTQVTTTTADSNGDFSFTIAVSDDSTVEYWASATDADGRVSSCTSTSISYEEDSTAPADPLVLTSSPSDMGESLTPSVTGTGETGATIEIFSDSGCTTSVGSSTASAGSYNATTSLGANIAYSLYARAEDAAGNQSGCSATFVDYETYTIADGSAEFKTTISTAGADINTTASLEWEAGYEDETYFTHYTDTDAEKVTVLVSGDYFAAVTLPQTSSLQRSAVSVEIYVNGTVYPGAIGDTGYIRNSAGHAESSAHTSVLLQGLTMGDEITAVVKQDGLAGTVNIYEQASMYIEYVAPTRTIFNATATTTTGADTDYNQTAANLEWTSDRSDTGYTHAGGSENIQVDSAGDYLIYVNVPVTGAMQRGNIITRVYVNGVQIAGGEAKQSYIRNSSGNNSTSNHFSGVAYNLSANDIITVSVEQAAAAGTVTAPTGHPATIMIEKLSSASDMFFGRATTVETAAVNWNPASKSAAEWTAADILDATEYGHNTGTNPHQVTITNSGDYLVVYNDAVDTAVTRSAQRVTLELDGTEIDGATCQTHYVRQSGHTNSSCSLVYFLRNVSAGSVLTLSSQQEAATGTVNDTDDTLLFIWKKM